MAEQPQAKNAKKLLIDLENSEDAHVRQTAAEQLGEQATNDETVISALKHTAQFDENKYVREAAHNSLVKLGTENLPLTENQPINAAKKPLTNWQAVGIGAMVGLFTVVLVFFGFALLSVGIFGIVFAVFFSVVGMPLCIIGALLGKYLSGRSGGAWMGGIIASIAASAISIYLVFGTCWGMC